jgi:hypothetical protein
MSAIRVTLNIIREMWMGFAQFLARINTFILLSFIYIAVFGVIALLLRLVRVPLLDKRHDMADSYWKSKPPINTEHNRQMLQF